MANIAAAMAADGGDPRLSVGGADHNANYIRPHMRLLHDSSVTFEEYHHYAKKTRAEEDEAERTEVKPTGIMQLLFPPKSGPGATLQTDFIAGDEKAGTRGERRESIVNANLANKAVRMNVTDEEWTNASRAMRTATWAALFYLITTDVLGPFGIG